MTRKESEAFGDKALLLLRQAVRDALARKRMLGQYAVFELNGQPIEVPPDRLPGSQADEGQPLANPTRDPRG